MCAFFSWMTFIDWKPDAITAAATIVLAALTTILAFGTIFLWRSTRRLVFGAERTAERQLRAYVTVGSEGISQFGGPAVTSIANVSVRNVGQVPARDVRWFINAAFSDNGRESNFPIGNDVFGQNLTIQPNTAMVRSQRFEIGNEETYTKFREGKNFLYVWGEITYLDGFDNRRYTLFCQRYNGRNIIKRDDPNRHDARSFHFIDAESMRYHQYGNDAN